MAHLYLPVEHSEADLVVAGQIAELIDSAELYVAWTPVQGRAVPELAAELRAAEPRPAGAVALLIGAVRVLLGALRQRELRRAA